MEEKEEEVEVDEEEWEEEKDQVEKEEGERLLNTARLERKRGSNRNPVQ